MYKKNKCNLKGTLLNLVNKISNCANRTYRNPKTKKYR